MHQRMMQPGFFFKDTDPVMQGKAGFHNILFLVMVFVFLLQVFKKIPFGNRFFDDQNRVLLYMCLRMHLRQNSLCNFYDRSPRRNPG